MYVYNIYLGISSPPQFPDGQVGLTATCVGMNESDNAHPAMEVHDQEVVLLIHVNLLTSGSQIDDIALWMTGIKQLIVHV